MTATVHHLPTAPAAKADRLRDLDEQAKALTVGDWVRVIWHHQESGARGTVEGRLTRPSHVSTTLFVGPPKGVGFCLILHGSLHPDVTAIETQPRPALDMDTLAERVALWCDAQLAFEQKPVGRFRTGDNTAEENAMLEAEDYVRAYLRSVVL